MAVGKPLRNLVTKTTLYFYLPWLSELARLIRTVFSWGLLVLEMVCSFVGLAPGLGYRMAAGGLSVALLSRGWLRLPHHSH